LRLRHSAERCCVVQPKSMIWIPKLISFWKNEIHVQIHVQIDFEVKL
jgi:hypothetical protein